ncbi:hypothetical protein [Knoellia koreensis]|uniref:Uncharacterized protein n=1 Tax=Knoellia koreensis TaxID=2730921 RepID=A0A849HFK7_9MICO|nr:hypothetical protein [Knoellia sp. DB2414S]NNM45394.1 hypothetical protein [Knoellia sp. DB2414S]
MARVHIGAGSPGISTGVGPVGFYQSLAGGGRGRLIGARTAGQTLAQAKAAQAQELSAAIRQVLDLHRVEFAPATRPLAQPESPVDTGAIRRRHMKGALAGVAFWNFKARRQAKTAAEAATQRELADNQARLAQLQANRQADLDRRWARLTDNDPEVVREDLAAAYEDNDAAAAVVAVEKGTASVVVLVPDVDVLPDRYPTTTQAGNLSLRRMSKTEQSELYRTMVAGYVLVTVKEALAVAPRLLGLRAVAIRIPRADAYGKPVVEPVLACHLTRQALSGVRWKEADATSVLMDAADEVVFRLKGAAKTLMPIELVAEPDIARLVAAVEVDELLMKNRVTA